MKAGKITAKIRDAVQVSFMENGDERARYKNIEIPDALKELEIKDFGFNVLGDGKIEFQLLFDRGILPEAFPSKRLKVTRAQKTAAKATAVDMKAAQTQRAATISAGSDTMAAKLTGSAMVATPIPKPMMNVVANQGVTEGPEPTTKPAAFKETESVDKSSGSTTILPPKNAAAPMKGTSPVKKASPAKDVAKK